MDKEQQAQFIGLLFDWKEGHIELEAIVEFINRMLTKGKTI